MWKTLSSIQLLAGEPIRVIIAACFVTNISSNSLNKALLSKRSTKIYRINMSYFVTQQTTTLSPFDEALERQRQPLLQATMAGDNETNTIKCGKGSLCSMVAHIYRNNCANTSPSSEIPFWSTKYREHDKMSRSNVDVETFMTETIDFEYENVDFSTSCKEPHPHQAHRQQQQLRPTQIEVVVFLTTVAISVIFLAMTIIVLVTRIIFA